MGQQLELLWAARCWGHDVDIDLEPEGRTTLVTGLPVQGKLVAHVAAGQSHTICTTADGSVCTWGKG